MGRKIRIVELAEEDKNELSELGYEALEATQAFLECLDKVTDGQIGEEMQAKYGQRRGVPGSGRNRGRYGRRNGGGGGSMGQRRGVAGTGRYGRRHDDDEEYEDDEEEYGSRGGGYGNRYDY